MSERKSADENWLVSRNAAREALADALRLYVGRGKRYSVKELSNGTGVPDRRIECAMARADDPDCREMPLGALLSIASFLGPEFTSVWLKKAEQGAFWIPDTDDTPPGMLAADASEDSSAIVRCAADGVIDLDDRRTLAPVGRRMMARGAMLAFGAVA